MNKIDEIKENLIKIKKYSEEFETSNSNITYTEFDSIKESLQLVLNTFTNSFLQTKNDKELININDELLKIINEASLLKKSF